MGLISSPAWDHTALQPYPPPPILFCTGLTPAPRKTPFWNQGLYCRHTYSMRQLYRTVLSAVADLTEIEKNPEKKMPLITSLRTAEQHRNLCLPQKAGAWVPSRGHTLPPSTQPSIPKGASRVSLVFLEMPTDFRYSPGSTSKLTTREQRQPKTPRRIPWQLF